MKIKWKRFFKLIIPAIIVIVLVVIFLINIINVISNSTGTFIVEEGNLSYEEEVEGYIIRDEQLLSGSDDSGGISQIVTDGTRVSLGEAVFRYYSANENDIENKISTIDNEIDEILTKNQMKVSSVETISLDTEIKNTLDELYKINSIQKIDEYSSRLNGYTVKKAETIGNLNLEDTELKDLIDTRKELENELTIDSETIYAPQAGLISYRVDGLEDVLKVNDEDFSYLSKEMLDEFDLKVGTTIPESTEVGKIVNNYYCYIACVLNSENADLANVGDKTTLKMSDGTEVNGEIVYKAEVDKDIIIVFKINRNVEELLEYRKISFEIIWWNYSGWKVSNNALIDENDLIYVVREKAGVEEKILVKVLRQNSSYSIVTNYTEEELQKLGFSSDEIQNMPKIQLYDKIVVKK